MFTQYRQRLISYLTHKQNWINNLKTLVLMVFIVTAITFYQQRDMTTGPAPTLSNATLIANIPGAETIDYSQGPSLIYFWGSWCPICKTTSPSVSTLADEGDYQIISIALSSGNHETIQDYQKEHGYHFKTLNDDNGEISKQWGVAVTPSIFYVDTEGEITAISTGMTSLWGMRFRLWLSSL